MQNFLIWQNQNQVVHPNLLIVFCALPHSNFYCFPHVCSLSFFSFFLFSVLSLLFSLFDKDILPLPLLSSLPLFTICQCDMFLVCWRQEGVKRQTDTNTQTHTHSQLLLSIHQSKPLHELWRILWTTSDLCTHLLIYALSIFLFLSLHAELIFMS